MPSVHSSVVTPIDSIRPRLLRQRTVHSANDTHPAAIANPDPQRIIRAAISPAHVQVVSECLALSHSHLLCNSSCRLFHHQLLHYCPISSTLCDKSNSLECTGFSSGSSYNLRVSSSTLAWSPDSAYLDPTPWLALTTAYTGMSQSPSVAMPY